MHAHWVHVLKGDKRAIFAAASKAAQAVDYLHGVGSERFSDGDRNGQDAIDGGQFQVMDQETRQ